MSIEQAHATARRLTIDYMREPREIKVKFFYTSPDNYGMAQHSMGMEVYTSMDRLRETFGDIPELREDALKYVTICDDTLTQYSGYSLDRGLWYKVADHEIKAIER
jgi:hypothetical protein